MSSAGTPLPAASFPLPPPLGRLPIIDPRTGTLNQVGLEFMTKLWAGIQGSGGAIDQLAAKLDKALAVGSIFVGGTDGNAHGVPMSGDATIDDTGEITVARVRVQMTAGVDLSGHRGVIANSSGQAVYPSIATLADGVGFVGVTTGAIATADAGPVQVLGNMEEPAWAWTPGQPIYLDDLGVLTQAIPSGAYILQIGVARTATQIALQERYLVATP